MTIKGDTSCQEFSSPPPIKASLRHFAGEDGSTLTITRSGGVGLLEYRNDDGRSFPAWKNTVVASWPDDIPMPTHVGASSTDGTRGAGLGLTLGITGGSIVVYNRQNQAVNTDQATIHCMLFW